MSDSRVPEIHSTARETMMPPPADACLDAAVSFLGSGTMGTALLAGSLRGGLAPGTTWVAARRIERAEELSKEFGVRATTSSGEAVRHAEIIVLAVPPAAVPEVLVEVRNSLPSDAVVVSIADQVSLANLHEFVPSYTAVVRVMPSLMCEIGSGISLVTFDERCTSVQRQKVEKLLGRSGRVIETSEKDQSTLAVLSSGGPGYFAYFVTAMIEALTEQGVVVNTAQEVAVAAMGGTAQWLGEPDRTPFELLRKVCTPGGAGSHRIAELNRLGVAAGITAALTKNVYE